MFLLASAFSLYMYVVGIPYQTNKSESGSEFASALSGQIILYGMYEYTLALSIYQSN